MEMTEQDRVDLEAKFGKMSDKRWGILVAEVSGADEDEDLGEVIVDVVTHFDDYEKEYDFWESK
jgi:hypothetical protein